MPGSDQERAVNALDMKFPMNNDKSIRDYTGSLWNILGNPIHIEGKTRFPYQRVDIPFGKKTRLTAERGMGLFGQWERPDWRPGFDEDKDIRLTLSRNI